MCTQGSESITIKNYDPCREVKTDYNASPVYTAKCDRIATGRKLATEEKALADQLCNKRK